MLGRVIFLPLIFMAVSSARPAGPPNPVRDVAGSAVDVGRVFQSGQTDGLILYAMILGTFLMFLIAAGLAVLVLRSQKNHSDAMATAQADHSAAMHRKDEQIATNTSLMIAATDRMAEALRALSVSVASDVQERAANGQTLAQIQALMGKLANVE